MSKMKKVLLMCTTYALVAALAIGGTLAYLQDEDSDVNVMTLGNVSIEQIEQEWNADKTALQDFTQAKPLYPYVGTLGWANTEYKDGAYRCFTMNNVIDKYVSVKNTGKTDAYVRTIIAFEMGDCTYDELGAAIGASINAYNGSSYKFDGAWEWTDDFVAEIDGKNYNIMVAVHQNAVEPGDTTIPSLLQVYMNKEATNETCEKLDGNDNGTYDILVLSQAVQAAGFADAKTALDTAFGDVTAETAATWFGGTAIPELVTTADQLQTALDDAEDGAVITLGADITGNVIATQKENVKITIDGNGYTFAGTITVDGQSKTYTTAGLTVKNLTFKADSISADACIQLGDGTTATRYTCNVTVENCTFDVADAAGIKSYTGGDKNLTIRNCTAATEAHSLAQLKGIDGVLVEDCTVNSIRGINFNNSDNITIIGTTFDVQKYAVRFGESANTTVENYEIIDCTIESDNVDNDAAIVLRAGATDANLTLDNVTINATIEMTGTENANVTIK